MPMVRRIMDAVRRQGDAALHRYTRRFDKVTVGNLQVSPAEISAAYARVPPGLVKALRAAMANIETFHHAHLRDEAPVRVQPGVTVQRVVRPIERVGLYVPGGRAAYPSSVLMMAVPARLAGCPQRILCLPPGRDGRVPDAALVAADLAGISEIYKVGGAQAIAAMAYGTETIPKVYKIFGPGNRYVTAAKILAAADGSVSIDLPAGPSEMFILADETAKPDYLAADLLSEVEHGPDSAAVLVTTTRSLARAVARAIEKQVTTLPTQDTIRRSLATYGLILVVPSLDDALEMVNTYAPEHLELVVRYPRRVLQKVVNAGAVFLGPFAPAAAGDYATGSNHVLPTGEFTKMYSPLSVDAFVHTLEVQEVTPAGLARLAPIIRTLADTEGFPAHRRAIDIRLER